ncbi:threonine/homoserine/homoserine lactone efflux protein [Nicoletella semolina]|uniref:Threonine/homoserine/homoserine lactone efflux protein n=1 Tax=Nicoletella semolina TaxID=271160 RepID=A0A4R2NC30_9PAST|nr:LysE family transporter [Nicoletella semolina]MDH2925058.1 hypothetical protein [Nicoletella semolina]TCP18608.1 threonine/homoserine/homoserine lactone efflux protein [Nicoletella semolina]
MWTIFLLHIVGLISPGPDFFYVTRKAMSESSRSAFFASLGITLGVGFWTLIVLFGLAFINKVLPSFQSFLMVLGGGYLAYSGLGMVQVKKNAKWDNSSYTVKHYSAWEQILKGLMINLSNPKIVVFFSSVLAGYTAQLTTFSELFAVLFLLISSSLAYFSLVGVLFSRKPIRDFYAKNSRYLDNIAGVIFILFGSKLIYEGFIALI